MPISPPSSRGSSAPEACAGLRQALLHEAQTGFPLTEVPFQVLSRRHGGSVRELLGHCQALQREGTLAGIRVHWSPALWRVQWRCGLAAVDGAWPALAAGTPGLTAWERSRPQAGCTVWFDFMARDEGSAARQLAPIEARYGPLRRLRGGSALVPCGGDGCPCADPTLAAACEAGLPLVARPWRALARRLQRPERTVLASLRRWQQSGRLAGLGIDAPERPHAECWVVASIAGPPLTPAALQMLGSAPGVAELRVAPADGDWPYAAWVAARGLSADPLERALRGARLAADRVRLLPVQRTRVRDEPRLFA
jgi:hypothetical protein